jgi:imidazolonepropionase-like amidohydrolase
MLALTNGTIHTITNGIIENGTILIDDGVIKEIGQNLNIPEGSSTIQCDGKNIYPGFIEAHCHLAMIREGVGPVGNNGNEKTSPVTSDLQAFDSIDIQDMSIGKALFEGGVTMANISPGSANVIGGQTDIISVYPARTPDELHIKSSVAMKMAFGENPFRVYGGQNKPPATRMGIAALIREEMIKTQDYMEAKKDAAEKGTLLKRDVRLEASSKLLTKEIRAHCHAHESFDILMAIRIAKEFDYNMTIIHGTESTRVMPELIENKISIILGPQSGHNGKLENAGRSLDSGGILEKEGIEFSISTDHPVIPLRDLRVEAAKMVNAGMTAKRAIEAMTIIPAKILGVDDIAGSIEVGKRADLIVWSGDPLDVAYGKVEVAIVGGKIR